MLKKTAKNDQGTVDYHLPSIPEAMRLLGEMGIRLDPSSLDEVDENEFVYLSKMMEKMEPFIDKIELKVEGQKISTFQGFMADTRCFEMACMVAGGILSNMLFTAKKKRPSKTRASSTRAK